MELTALKSYRERMNLSRGALAESLGVTRMTVWRWENGARRIDDSIIGKIVSLTGLPVHELRPDLPWPSTDQSQ